MPPTRAYGGEEKDEKTESKQPRRNKYQRRLAGTQVAKQLTDCAHDEAAVVQKSVDSTVQSRGNESQRCFAEIYDFKELAKGTQELLALRQRSVNSTRELDC